MRHNPFSLSNQAADMVGVAILLVLAIGLVSVMLFDYRRFLRTYTPSVGMP